MRWKLITYLLLIQSLAREYVWNYINCFASIYLHSTAICQNMFRPVLVFYMNIQKINRFVNAQAHYWMTACRGRKDTYFLVGSRSISYWIMYTLYLHSSGSQESIAPNHFYKSDQEHAFSSLFRTLSQWSCLRTKIEISSKKRVPGRNRFLRAWRMLIQTLHNRRYMVRTKFRILFLPSQFNIYGDKPSMIESGHSLTM